MLTLAFFEGMFSGWHMIIVLIIALLLFGRRLPEVGRSLGKGISEFKKGMKEVGDEMNGPAEQGMAHSNYAHPQQYPQMPQQQRYQSLPPQQPQAAGVQQGSQYAPAARVNRNDMMD